VAGAETHAAFASYARCPLLPDQDEQVPGRWVQDGPFKTQFNLCIHKMKSTSRPSLQGPTGGVSRPAKALHGTQATPPKTEPS